jgi:tetratricopeptide (TPR) repeat protein
MRALKELAGICYFLGKYRESEDLSKRLIMIREREYGPNSWRTLQSKLFLISSITEQGRFDEAKNMIDDVHKDILRVDTSGGSLVQNSLQIMGAILNHLENYEKAESVLRELVQMKLITLGPRHGDTLAAIERLSYPISLVNRFSESEELLRIALELGRTAPEFSDSRKCQAIRLLAVMFSCVGMRRQEGEALCRMSVECSERLSGEDDWETLRSKCNLARELKEKGLLHESDILFERTARKQIEMSGEYSLEAISIVKELCCLLLETCQYKKAGTWLEKLFHVYRKLHGPDHEEVLNVCDELGRCYEGQGRYQDALNLYEQMSQETGEVVGSNHPSIARLARWMEWGCRRLDNVGAG